MVQVIAQPLAGHHKPHRGFPSRRCRLAKRREEGLCCPVLPSLTRGTATQQPLLPSGLAVVACEPSSRQLWLPRLSRLLTGGKLRHWQSSGGITYSDPPSTPSPRVLKNGWEISHRGS